MGADRGASLRIALIGQQPKYPPRALLLTFRFGGIGRFIIEPRVTCINLDQIMNQEHFDHFEQVYITMLIVGIFVQNNRHQRNMP